MRTCEYCGRSTEGRHEQCKGCNAPLPAKQIEYPYYSDGGKSPILSPSYYTLEYKETYAGQIEELQNRINEAWAEIGKAMMSAIANGITQ